MSRFAAAAATMQTLSLAAMEEASRVGVHDADLEHLFLALTLDPGDGGQVLRAAGVTLDAARAAIAAEQRERLASLGVAAAPPREERIVFHETDGYAWTDRAASVLAEASNGPADGGSAGVLRRLVAEPSGTIEALLRRLSLDGDDLRTRLDEVATLRRASRAAAPATRGASGSLSAFIPAPLDAVWALVGDGARLSEWDAAVAAVSPTDDGGWAATAPTEAPDGRPLRMKPERRRLRIRPEGVEPPVAVTWRLSYPDARRSNERVVRFVLEPAAGGTQAHITCGWERTDGRRSLIGRLLRPLARLLIFVQLTQISSGVSRVFR